MSPLVPQVSSFWLLWVVPWLRLLMRCTGVLLRTGFDDPSIKPMEAAKACHAWCSKIQQAIDSKDIDTIA